MGIGVGLTLIAIGAIFAFALDFSLSGVDINAIGWILMVCGAAGIAFTLLYVRPRRAVVPISEEDAATLRRADEIRAEEDRRDGIL
ncbi:DUF6458 family protein [Actinocorallia sp. A-T 12471]|uniref:DUF6458 family protein n=1 Tax=Actinocorallia sp. A-T 12471 TaxID=3089813 RepID=UPI0029CB0782|nr:DUF6458 family protein [Actinocorallia sp. A-T 12471]MDX6742126.1 DUF6458 family protein [Actinocorallia sp. A-T 12471]